MCGPCSDARCNHRDAGPKRHCWVHGAFLHDVYYSISESSYLKNLRGCFEAGSYVRGRWLTDQSWLTGWPMTVLHINMPWNLGFLVMRLRARKLTSVTLCKKESQLQSKKTDFSQEKSRKSQNKVKKIDFSLTFLDWNPFFLTVTDFLFYRVSMLIVLSCSTHYAAAAFIATPAWRTDNECHCHVSVMWPFPGG